MVPTRSTVAQAVGASVATTLAQGRRHAATGKYIPDQQQHAAQEAGQRPVGDLNVAVDSAAGGNAAATLGAAQGHCPDDQRTS